MDMIGYLGEALGVEPQMDMLPMQPGDVPATYADISAIKRDYGFEPTTSLEEGLPRFIGWYRQHFNR